MKQIFLSALIGAGLLLGFSSQSYACSCMMPADPVTSMESSESVFAGKVVDITNSDMINTVQFEVSTIWKGIEPTRITIETPEQSATCGYNFEKEKEYLVYAYKKTGGGLGVSLCSRTSLLENAGDDIIALDNESKLAEEGGFCGGIAGVQCKEGLSCELNGDYPDAGGTCQEEEIRMCTMQYDPVCGIDGNTYGNSCMAGSTEIAYKGECSMLTELEESLSPTILSKINTSLEKYESRVSTQNTQEQYILHLRTIERIDDFILNIPSRYAEKSINFQETLKDIFLYIKLRVDAML